MVSSLRLIVTWDGQFHFRHDVAVNSRKHIIGF